MIAKPESHYDEPSVENIHPPITENLAPLVLGGFVEEESSAAIINLGANPTPAAAANN